MFFSPDMISLKTLFYMHNITSKYHNVSSQQRTDMEFTDAVLSDQHGM